MFKETQDNNNGLERDCTQTVDVSEVNIYSIHVNLQIQESRIS